MSICFCKKVHQHRIIKLCNYYFNEFITYNYFVYDSSLRNYYYPNAIISFNYDLNDIIIYIWTENNKDITIELNYCNYSLYF